MLEIRNNSSRARIAIIVFFIIIVINVLNILSLLWQHQLLIGVRDNPEAIDMSALHTSDSIQAIIGYTLIGITLASIITFIMWFRRAYYNVHMIPDSSPSFTEGWAAGAWFVPIMNLFRPFQIMKEIWLETQRVIAHRLPGFQTTTLVGIWWAFYVSDLIFGQITYRVVKEADEVNSLITATQMELVNHAIGIGSSIVTIVMIRKMHDMEKELYAEAQEPNDSVFSLMPAPAAGETQS